MREKSQGRIRVAESLDSAGNGDALEVADMFPITVVVIPAEAVGKVQYSTTPEGAEGGYVWRDWSHGEVSETTEDVIDGPITAMRLVMVSGSGSVGWEVCA